MNENDRTFKPFNQTPITLAELPPLVRRILEGKQFYPGMSDEDLREMSKFWEIPNVEGLAAHPVERPGAADEPEVRQGAPELSEGVLKSLDWELTRTPAVLTAGELAGGSGRPFRVAVIAPQSYSQLNQALQRMLWPLADSAAPLDYTLLAWPEPLKRKNGSVVVERLVRHWPDEGTGVIVGHDDPALMARLLAAAARRRWEADLPQARAPRAGEGFATVEREGNGEDDARAVFHEAHEGTRPGAGELPAMWDEVLIEPGALTPLWVNPLLPAALLSGDEAWRTAARAVGALPLGVEVTDEGYLPPLHGRRSAEEVVEMNATDWRDAAAVAAGGWVVVKRNEAPALFLREARRYRA